MNIFDKKWVSVSDSICLLEVVSNAFVKEVLEDGEKVSFVDKVVDRNGLFDEEDVVVVFECSISLTCTTFCAVVTVESRNSSSDFIMIESLILY